jgi:hypothetical protein
MIEDKPNSLVDAILWALFLLPLGISCVAFGFFALRSEWEKRKEIAELPFSECLKTLGTTLLIFAVFVWLGIYLLWDLISRFLQIGSR